MRTPRHGGMNRIGYVCEGASTIGWGHVGRGRALVESAPEASLLIGCGFDEIRRWCDAAGVRLPLMRWHSASEPVDLGEPLGFHALIVDSYTVADQWLRSADRLLPVFLVDDWMRTTAPCRGLINPNLGATAGDYDPPPMTAMCGAEFTLLRREVRERVPEAVTAQVREVVITLGGSDPDARVNDVVSMVSRCTASSGVRITIVLGASYTGPEAWTGWGEADRARLQVLRQPPDFVDRCARADIVICGASTTTYELAYLGRPFVPLAFADNQARIAAEWRALRVGSGVPTWEHGWRQALEGEFTRLLASHEARVQISRLGRSMVDGRGVERILATVGARAR